MADATVSMVLNRLAPLIDKKVREEVTLLLNAENEVRELSSKLKRIHEVLEDAERKLVNDPRVVSWLQKLQDIVYEIDDALDEWEVENIKQRLEESEDDTSKDPLSDSLEKKLCVFLEFVCSCFRQTVRRRSIALDVKGISQRLDSIAQENENEFKFVPNVGRVSKDFKRVISTSFVDVSEVQGRELDKGKVMDALLSEGSTSQGRSDPKIVSIVGGGGMGKTTLAQIIFNDAAVKEFEVMIWVCVSDPFDEIMVSREILSNLNPDCRTNVSFQILLQSIAKYIEGKKFLLILDDVWIEEKLEVDMKWRPIEVSLKNGAEGSRILVTTRKEKVAKIMDSVYVHSLEPLEETYCWSVLRQIAFHERSERECEMLKEIGREIAKKCKGLPLAAKTIGGVLRFKSSFEEWQNVLKSEMWELEKVKEDIFPFLTLSYDELHPILRRCFSYCAIFPKDTFIEVDMLIRMWMANGFFSISSRESSKIDGELIGREYFNDLAMRSFFQDFVKDDLGQVIKCKLHDMVHDFAQFLTNNECLIVDQVYEGEEMAASNTNVRHLTMLSRDARAFNSTLEYEKLRTFVCSYLIPPKMFTRLKKVRIVSMIDCELQDIPNEIGDLIHVRYLDLSDNCDIVTIMQSFQLANLMH